jgi:hypothetical protein
MLKIVVIFLSVLLVGCTGTTAKLNKVSIGMTKSEVVRQIGRPDSVSAKGSAEYLIYYWATPKQIFADENNLPEYYIRLVDGKVESYGKMGDFDSAQVPETKTTIDLNINK